MGGGADASLQDADGQTPLDKAVAQVGPAQALHVLQAHCSMRPACMPLAWLSNLRQKLYLQGHGSMVVLLQKQASNKPLTASNMQLN